MFSASLLIPDLVVPFFLCKILPQIKGTQLRATCKREPHTRTCRCVPGAAPPTQLLSRECAGPSNSERKSEQEAEILLRAGKREEWVKGGCINK